MAHGWVNQMNICLSISLYTSFTKYTIWQKFIIALTLYGLFITICKLFKYLLKTLLYIQIIILTPLMKRLKKKKRSPYTLGDKELLQTSMLSGNKRKLEGYSIYFSGVAFHTEMYTQEKKTS